MQTLYILIKMQYANNEKNIQAEILSYKQEVHSTLHNKKNDIARDR